jgi:iron(III) transport system substrate-binding protein
MRMRSVGPVSMAMGLLLVAGCGPAPVNQPPEEAVVVPAEGKVVVYVDAPRRLAGPVLRAFEEQSGIDVEPTYREVVGDGFRDRLLSEARLGRVDLVWGSSPLAAADLLREGLALPFRPAGARPVLSQYRDSRSRWIGFAVNPRVIIYNYRLVEREEAPASIEDMVRPPWGGRGVLARPVHGGAAFHAAALYALWGPDRARDYFRTVASNGTRFVGSEQEVRAAVASGEAVWGIIDLDLAIGAKREADPLHIFYPDRMAQGAVTIPHIALLVRDAPNLAQAKGLFGYLFSTDAAFQFGQNDSALITLIPNVPKPEWVPVLGQFNVTRIDNDAVLQAFADESAFLSGLGLPPASAAAAAR